MPKGAVVIFERCESSVDVAEGTSKSVHSLALGDVGELTLQHGAQTHSIVQGTVAAGRQVQEGDGACDSVLAVFDVLVLPCPPVAVDLGVVNYTMVRASSLDQVRVVLTEEPRISWRVVEVSTGIATNGVVASRMNANVLFGEVTLDRAVPRQ